MTTTLAAWITANLATAPKTLSDEQRRRLADLLRGGDRR